MHKINVVNNKIIPFDDDSIMIDNDSLIFLDSGDYVIEYIECNNIEINFNIKNNLCIQLFEFSNNNSISLKATYNLDKSASLIINKFYSNENTDETVNVYLKETKANIKYNFSSIGNKNDKYNINIYHLAKETRSDIFNRTVARKGSINIFDINSYVENGVCKCFLNQSTKIITLGESINKINPNMFIAENSTTATHSSVIGNMRRDELFYLMSRGITYKSAINLIVKGLIISNINPNIEMKEKILNILEKLGGE